MRTLFISRVSFYMKRLLLSMMLCVCGCSIVSNKSNQPSNSLNPGQASSTSEECPEKPEVVLDSQNVKSITLSEQKITESGIASKTKSQGYSFEAQAGQKINYQTNQDICIWIYTPDNQLLGSGILPSTGKYILQVSALKGSKTFELEMGLDVPQASRLPNQAASTTSSSLSKQPIIPALERPAADDLVRNYYISLNNRQYSNTWSKLSPNFKSISGSYSEYQQWWNSVREIKIGDIYLINQSKDSALVDAELWYVMNDGRVIKDSKSYIYLIWSNESNSWLFDYKSTP